LNGARISELLKTRPKTSLYWGVYLASPKSTVSPDLGIAVAKKLAKRAVDRNKLKRMIRDAVWAAQTTTLQSDVVIKLKKPIGAATRGRLRKTEKDLLRSQILGLI
jgi:ribonuclease P protein component